MAEKIIERKKDRSAARKPSAKVSQAEREHQVLRFERRNWILFGGGIGSIALGFLLLRYGDITLSPILLLAGYLVLIPWSLVARSKRAEGASDRAEHRVPPTA